MKTRISIFTKVKVLAVITTFLAVLATPPSAEANIVGYINLFPVPGDNLIANQFLFGDSTINSVLTNSMANGAVFKKWNSALNSFSPASTFNAATLAWDINFSLGLGEGGVLTVQSSFTTTVVGEVGPNANIDGTPRLINWNPNYANGIHLISCPVPFGDATFNEVVGRAPLLGESVRRLNEASQIYTTTIFDGFDWDNGTPLLTVGESAYFNLGPVIVPEPSVFALFLSGSAGALFIRAQRNRQSS
jgi:hypothetical protein